jgi:RNA polymerase sigma-70 factor (ECF subfamily)
MIFEDIESFSVVEDTGYDGLNMNAEAETRVHKVMEVIKSLPEKCREILSLYLLEGYDHEEIAEILSISTSTSRSQLSRARNRIISEVRRKV